MKSFRVIDEGTLDHVFACEACGEVFRYSNQDLGQEEAQFECEKDHDSCEDARCDWCGGAKTEERPVKACVISPPVDGYKVESVFMHEDCADEAARAMVE